MECFVKKMVFDKKKIGKIDNKLIMNSNQFSEVLLCFQVHRHSVVLTKNTYK